MPFNDPFQEVSLASPPGCFMKRRDRKHAGSPDMFVEYARLIAWAYKTDRARRDRFLKKRESRFCQSGGKAIRRLMRGWLETASECSDFAAWGRSQEDCHSKKAAPPGCGSKFRPPAGAGQHRRHCKQPPLGEGCASRLGYGGKLPGPCSRWPGKGPVFLEFDGLGPAALHQYPCLVRRVIHEIGIEADGHEVQP